MKRQTLADAVERYDRLGEAGGRGRYAILEHWLKRLAVKEDWAGGRERRELLPPDASAAEQPTSSAEQSLPALLDELRLQRPEIEKATVLLWKLSLTLSKIVAIMSTWLQLECEN